jgi:hypothetical protein
MDKPNYSDAAKRMSDAMNLHAVAKSQGWASFALADGSTDLTPYSSWSEAVRFKNWDRDNYLYLEIPPDGMPAHEAECVLKYARALHNAGYRIPGPDFNHDPSVPMFSWDKKSTINTLVKKKVY